MCNDTCANPSFVILPCKLVLFYCISILLVFVLFYYKLLFIIQIFNMSSASEDEESNPDYSSEEVEECSYCECDLDDDLLDMKDGCPACDTGPICYECWCHHYDRHRCTLFGAPTKQCKKRDGCPQYDPDQYKKPTDEEKLQTCQCVITETQKCYCDTMKYHLQRIQQTNAMICDINKRRKL